MTDSSANPRSYGERPLHEDDPLMELSRIMDFGASADNNVARSEYRPEPNFDSGDNDLSFDLERELLGDFGNSIEPEQHSAPYVTPAYEPHSYQDAEPAVQEDVLASALEEEFDLHLDANEPLAPAESFEFVEADRSEPVPQFDYNDYSEARTAYEETHPDAYAAHAPVEPLEQNYSNYNPSAYQPSEDPYDNIYATEPAPLPSDGNDWEFQSAKPFEASYAAEPSHQPLSLEDELENLLFSDEPQSAQVTETAYDEQPEPVSAYTPRYAEPAAEAPTSAYAEPAYREESDPVFDDFQLDEPEAYEPVEAAANYAPESVEEPQAASQSAQTPIYPHYALSNFAAGAATAGVLSPEPTQAAAEYESEQVELDDDFSFDDFTLETEQSFAPVAVEATGDELSGLDEISFNEDDFGFEASGDASSPVATDDANLFTEEDFFTADDLDLSVEAESEQVETPYAHATYSEEEQHPAAPSFTNYADPRSSFAAPAPEIETLSVSDSKVEQTHSLDLPEVSYGEEENNAGLTDLETEFAEVFNTIGVDETAAKTDAQSEADKAFEDIFRESASSYMPNAGVAAGTALGVGAAAAAATMAYGRANPTAQPASPQNPSGSSDDFYNHWAAQGAQTMESGEFGTRAAMQPEDDLGSAAEAYRNRPVRGRRGLILASVAGIAVLIGGIGYHFLGGSGSGEPVVIRADNQPIKVQPENPGGATVPNQDKAVYDRVAGTLPNNPEQKSLISAGEEPVDLGATQDNEVGTDDAPEPNQAAGNSAESGQESPLIQPREVETMIVRPDGTIVQAQQPAQTPPQAAPVNTANNSAPIAPPAETDEIAALAAGNAPQEPVANTPVTQPTPATQAPAPQVRAPVVPSRPAEQPTTIVGNVPQRTQAQAPAAAPQVASAAGAGGYFIQIASQPSAELAQKSYANMAQRYGSVIGGRAVDIKRADIPNKGTYYRVRVQAGSKDDASALCGRLKTAGGSCFVTQ